MKRTIKWNLKNVRSPVILNDINYNPTNLKHFDRNSPLTFKYYLCFIVIFIFYCFRKIGIGFHTYPNQFGHQSFDIEFYLRSKRKKSFINIFLASPIIINEFLFKKHKKLIFIIKISNYFYKKLHLCNKISMRYFNKSIFHTSSFEFKWLFTSKDEWINQPNSLNFTSEEREICERFFKKMKIEKYNYVLFSSRNRDYYLRKNLKLFSLIHNVNKNDAISEINKHEDKLVQSFRNMDFNDYKKAINFLSQKNVKSIRIGTFDQEALVKDKNFLDFSFNLKPDLEHSELIEFYLLHNCKFFVNCCSGLNCAIISIPRPALIVNAFPWPWISTTTRKFDQYIPKIYSNDEFDQIPFRSLITLSKKMDWRTLYDSNEFFYQNKNLKVIDNSPDDILSAVKEMYLSIDHPYSNRKDKLFLRSKFNKLITKNSTLSFQKSQICYFFLKKYKHLLY